MTCNNADPTTKVVLPQGSGGTTFNDTSSSLFKSVGRKDEENKQEELQHLYTVVIEAPMDQNVVYLLVLGIGMYALQYPTGLSNGKVARKWLAKHVFP